MNHVRCDAAVVGGGILGLATALEITSRFPQKRLVVIEKEPHVGTHQTGHNSGVIHSGIYYSPRSEKARLCVEGMRLMLDFCEIHGIEHARCGKVIVATEERELSGLASLHERGLSNGVPGLELIGVDRLNEIEPHVRALQALHSPGTSIVDYRSVAQTMARVITQQGVEILTSARVTGIVRADGDFYLKTPIGDLRTGALINCAGLYADEIAMMTGVDPDVRIVPFRGEYYRLRVGKKNLVNGMVYPVPDPTFPFLGVHFTKTVHGEVEAGPNAVLAFAREGYSILRVNPLEMWKTFRFPGFRSMVRRYWKTGMREFHRSLSKRAFLGSLRRLVPELEAEDIERGGAGVRAQAVGMDGRLVDDFRIVTAPDAIHVVNAPSPAATASLAIGKHLAELASGTFWSA